MILAGVASLGWAVVVWQWEDPFTSLYTKYEQRQLATKYDDVVDSYRERPAPVAARRPTRTSPDKPLPEERAASLAAERLRVEREAKRYRLGLTEGVPLGRLKVPRLGLNAIAVNGTEDPTLKKGPARYSGPLPSYVPGEGELVYIAGHRTTYDAPFSKIDRLRPGDAVVFELPYATFEYVVTGHRIVDADDVSVLRSHGREVVALQACHPRFFASHRYIVYAKLVRVVPHRGPAYTVSGSRVLPA